MTSSRRFCLLTPGRSGSTVLAHAINSSATVKAFLEVLHPGSVKNEYNFFNYLLKKQDPYALFPENRDSMFRSYLRYVEELCPEKLAYVYDVKYTLAHHVDGVFQAHSARPHLMQILKDEFHGVIHLVRESGLRRCISTYVAEVRQKWHSTSEEPSRSINVNTDRLRSDLMHLSIEQMQFSKYINTLGISILTISYEELFSFENGTFNVDTMRSLQTFLGTPEQLPTLPSLVQTTPEPLQSIVANYGAVCDAINTWIDKGELSKEAVLGRFSSLANC